MFIANLDAALGFTFKSCDYFLLSGQRTGIGYPNFETVSADHTLAGNLYAPLNLPSVIRICAGGNPLDDADGIGAQQVTVEGLGYHREFISAVLTTAGANASEPSSNLHPFLRINKVFVSRAGSVHVNAGNIGIEVSPTGGFNIGFIASGKGQSQTAFYSVPLISSVPMGQGSGAPQSTRGAAIFFQDGITLIVRGGPADVKLRAQIFNSENGSFVYQTLLELPSLAVGNHSIAIPASLRVHRVAQSGEDVVNWLTDLTILAAASAPGTTDVIAIAGGYFQPSP